MLLDPIRSAGSEVTALEKRARTMIDLAVQGLAPVKLDKKSGFERWIQRKPLGIVFVIAPWINPVARILHHRFSVKLIIVCG